jgi:hypothetical protein
MGYFSWAEYPFDQPPPTSFPSDRYDAVAVISNCSPNSFRMKAITELERFGIKIDKYGSCFSNSFDGNKLDLIAKYPFYLAFENSIENDYVTEK